MTDLPLATNVGSVVDALVAACVFDDVLTLDGPTPSPPRRDFLVIGAPDGAGEAIRQTLILSARAATFYDEQLDITCVLGSWAGQARGMKPRRDRCIEILGLVRAVLDADQTLGGICRHVRLGEELSWGEQAAANGTACTVGFTVRSIGSI